VAVTTLPPSATPSAPGFSAAGGTAQVLHRLLCRGYQLRMLMGMHSSNLACSRNSAADGTAQLLHRLLCCGYQLWVLMRLQLKSGVQL